MKAKITRSTLDKENIHQITIEAHPCVIKGFENYKFFVHKNDYGAMWSTLSSFNYVVTEKITGMIVYGGKTISGAVKSTEKFLQQKGFEAFEKQIQTRVKEYKLNQGKKLKRSVATKAQ